MRLSLHQKFWLSIALLGIFGLAITLAVYFGIPWQEFINKQDYPKWRSSIAVFSILIGLAACMPFLLVVFLKVSSALIDEVLNSTRNLRSETRKTLDES